MTKDRKKDAEISRTTGTDTVHERRKANPNAKDMADPKEVWKAAETSPSPNRNASAETGGHGRVADSGDVGKGQASPYSTETQADALAKQTDRKDNPRSLEKPKQ